MVYKLKYSDDVQKTSPDFLCFDVDLSITMIVIKAKEDECDFFYF